MNHIVSLALVTAAVTALTTAPRTAIAQNMPDELPPTYNGTVYTPPIREVRPVCQTTWTTVCQPVCNYMGCYPICRQVPQRVCGML